MRDGGRPRPYLSGMWRSLGEKACGPLLAAVCVFASCGGGTSPDSHLCEDEDACAVDFAPKTIW